MISQGADDHDIYFILLGSFDVIVNGQKVAVRGPTVGEMAAVEPAQKRSASVVAKDNATVARLSEEAFTDLGIRHPQMFRVIAQELARHLPQRNTFLGQ